MDAAETVDQDRVILGVGHDVEEPVDVFIRRDRPVLVRPDD
jgi:hypothetical protein